MPVKIYYLDDEVLLHDVFSDYFSAADVEVKTFAIPDQFISAVNKDGPDLLFIDYRLKGTTGDKIAQLCPVSIPKVLVSGENEFNLQFKFDHICEKPFNVDEIASVIRKYSGK